jgi:hypothetical protein
MAMDTEPVAGEKGLARSLPGAGIFFPHVLWHYDVSLRSVHGGGTVLWAHLERHGVKSQTGGCTASFLAKYFERVEERTCARCDAVFLAGPSDDDGGTMQHCSTACHDADVRDRG